MTLDREALTVAMAVAPSVLSRNRMFPLYKQAEVLRARARAAVLRGLVRQLCGLFGEVRGLSLEPSGNQCVVRYMLPCIHSTRHVELSLVELACLRYMLGKASARYRSPSESVLQPTVADGECLRLVLSRLADGLDLPQLT